MSHVHAAAKFYGADPYRPWANDIVDAATFDLAMRRNRAWIRRMMVEGNQILDIGYDTTRTPHPMNGLRRSPFYEMEKQEVANFPNYPVIGVPWPGHSLIYSGP